MWKVLPANIPCAFVLLFPIRWQNNFSDAGARALSNFRVTTLFWVFHLLWVSFFSGVALTPAARTQSQSEFMVRPGGWLFTIILSYDRRWSFWGAALPCKTSSKWYELSATEKNGCFLNNLQMVLGEQLILIFDLIVLSEELWYGWSQLFLWCSH